MLDAICKALSVATQSQIVVGAIPLNAFGSVQGVWSAKNELAREVLLRVLRSDGPEFTWLLEYDPATHRYYLSVTVVG